MKTIVISAANLNKGGTLTILRDCLQYLSTLARRDNLRVIALVYQKKLADYPNIEYIESEWPKRMWVNRLWYEYIGMRRISRKIGRVDLWFSLHDTTPNVVAGRQAVYCHNPFPFYRWKWHDCLFAPKIVLFSLFSRLIYQIGINKNAYVIVQQQWIKNAFKVMFSLDSERIVIAVPDQPDRAELGGQRRVKENNVFTFIYAASPNSHKNFEIICAAAQLLYQEGIVNFRILLTLSGTENPYSRWLKRKWNHSVPVIEWLGFQSRESLFQCYVDSDCLIFPSRVETWGLPITEFSVLDKPMLLANLPYAHETAAGSTQVAFFNPNQPNELALQMKRLIIGDSSFLSSLGKTNCEEPNTHSWRELFDILLSDANKERGE